MSIKDTVVILAGVTTLCIFPTMAIDYFADGCVVDYSHSYYRQVAPGVFQQYRGSTCHQYLIHTKRGQAREGDHQ